MVQIAAVFVRSSNAQFLIYGANDVMNATLHLASQTIYQRNVCYQHGVLD